MQSPEEFDPFAAETIADPYPFYAALRRAAAVYPLDRLGYSLVSRYHDCRQVALAPERFSSNLVAMVLAQAGESTALVTAPADTPRPVDVLAIADEPAHGRQRKLSNKAFSMRRVAALEPSVRELADSLLDPLLGDGGGRWMSAFAHEMPTRLICRLIGLPLDDRDQLRKWANDGSSLLSGVLTPEQTGNAIASVLELNRYLAARFELAKGEPGDDVLGDFVRATQEDAECLSNDEVVAILLQLLSAGTESTTALLGSAVLLLATHPALQTRLRRQPELVARFVEETLRLESPFQGHFRVANEDTAIGDTVIGAGTRLMLLWGSANRDEGQFEQPDRLDIDRTNLHTHVAFGIGAHHCIGAALARLEARVAIEELLARTRAFELTGEASFAYVPSLMVRRLEHLAIAIEA